MIKKIVTGQSAVTTVREESIVKAGYKRHLMTTK